MSTPSVSIIVPTYDRPERLAACLDALAQQEPPAGGVEVIVVDDGSPSPAAAVAAPFEDRMHLHVFRQENAGPAAARNAGAAHARGMLFAFTDDDCQPDPGWVCALADAHVRAPGHLLAGRTINALPTNAFSTASQLLIDYLYEYFGPESGRVPLVASNNLGIPADGFRALGGFDETFPLAAGEDRDLCARWDEAGKPVAAVPNATVRHTHPMGLREYWRQHANYGRGAYHYHRLRPSTGLDPEPLRFYADLVGYPLRRSRAPRSWLHAGLMGLSQVANVAGYTAERLSRR